MVNVKDRQKSHEVHQTHTMFKFQFNFSEKLQSEISKDNNELSFASVIKAKLQHTN